MRSLHHVAAPGCMHIHCVARSGQHLLDRLSIQVGPGEVVGLVRGQHVGKTIDVNRV